MTAGAAERPCIICGGGSGPKREFPPGSKIMVHEKCHAAYMEKIREAARQAPDAPPIRNLEQQCRLDSKVYVETPEEIRGFVWRSVRHILRDQFGRDFDSNDVVITDPFAGEAQFTQTALDEKIITPQTAAKIDHMELIPERAELARQKLRERGVRNPRVRNVDTFAESP